MWLNLNRFRVKLGRSGGTKGAPRTWIYVVRPGRPLVLRARKAGQGSV